MSQKLYKTIDFFVFVPFQLHRISSLNDAFNRRAGKLTFSIENNLREKALMIGA